LNGYENDNIILIHHDTVNQWVLNEMKGWLNMKMIIPYSSMILLIS